MSRLLLASALALVLAVPAHAQDGPEEGDRDVIIVLGQGLPQTPATPAYSTLTIERDRVVSSGSGRLEDVLSSVAGFQQFRRSDSRSSNPSAQGATLRALGGNATSRALVLLDGVPMADPFFGYIPFSAIAPERLAAITITRGGGSGPFGAGALAGTIELESADAETLGLASASALVNDRAETELSGMLAPQFGSGYAVIAGRWDRGKGFFTTPEAERVAATVRARHDSWSANARVVQEVGGLEVQLRGLAFRDERVLRFAGADTSSEGQDVSLRVVSRGPWQVDALVYGQWRNFTNVVISSTTFNRSLDQRDTPSEGQGAKLELRPPVGGGHTLRIGADYRRSAGELAEDAYNAATGALTQRRFAGGENRQIGLFVENDWETGPLVLTGGLRADRTTIADGFFRRVSPAGAVIEDLSFADRSDWEVTWRGGGLLRASEAVAFRAAAYSGFRLPTLNELYRPFVVFPVTTNANAALAPERLEGWEAGFDLTPRRGVSFKITYFDNRIEGAIANVTIAPNTRQRQNVRALSARGLELAGGFERGAFSIDGTVTLTDPEVRGDGAAAALDGNLPAQTPTIAASLTASWRPFEGAILASTLRHIGEQFEDDLETEVLPAATTLDLFAQAPLVRGVSAVVRVENLTGERIVTRSQGGSIDLGAPRTVWAGLRFGF